jgi:hypothetical protein
MVGGEGTATSRMRQCAKKGVVLGFGRNPMIDFCHLGALNRVGKNDRLWHTLARPLGECL